jgi:hypothetical protein
MTDSSGWRKRQIALDKKADNARQLGLDYEPFKREHMTDKETLKLALEALENLFDTNEHSGGVAVWRLGGSAQPREAIIALKEALAQTEQEPVACTHEWVDDTKAKPQWRCIKCGIEYTKEKNT